MKIVIDGRLWSETGPGRYIRNLVNGLEKIDRENEYYVFLLEKDFKTVSLEKNFTKILTPFRWYSFGEQINLPKIINHIKPDLVHFPMFNVPIFYRGKFIVTIHDLIHHHFQMKKATTHNALFYQVKTLGYNTAFSSAVKKSLKVVVPSRFVKAQLVDEYKIPESKVVVTYEAAEEKIVNLAQKNIPSPVSKPYLFYVGNTHPHKNIPFLIQGWKILRGKYPDLKLVLAGPETIFYQQLKKEYSVEGIDFLGQVSEEELVALYKNAEAYIFPSLEEGFGIPVLEAMACGCPVVSSNAASLPEVGGDAALYFNPKDEDDMVKTVEKVLRDKGLRQELIKKGERRYKEFSWKKMAEETLKIYREV